MTVWERRMMMHGLLHSKNLYFEKLCKPRAGGKVVLSDGVGVEYDWLVLSLGSESSTLGVPGVKEHAVLFNTITDALQVNFANFVFAPSVQKRQNLPSLQRR
jgi:hypothetical protein